ncbi:hypothetical protein M3Y97_00664200 [Aphelenchoides bicaudatus]|nr:hypothetical protein M3Y97_00664200 [Aphelenchoides bicaudatus]
MSHPPKPRLKGQAQDLLVEHLCTGLDDLHRVMENISLDESTTRRIESTTTVDPCMRLLRFMLSSNSNLKTVRRFFHSATFKLYPTKCYLKPARFQELMLSTQTTISILKLICAQNLELYIDSDEVRLSRFAEFEDHLKDFTRLHLECIHVASNNKFEHIVKKMAPQLQELECPANTINYVYSNPSHPILKLKRLRLQYTLNSESVDLERICEHDIQKLHLIDISGVEMEKFQTISAEQAGKQSIEELHIQATTSTNTCQKMLKFVFALREKMPKMRFVELTMTEVFKHNRFNGTFIEWTLQRYNSLLEFHTRTEGQFQRLTVRINIQKVLQNEGEPISNWVNALRQTPEFEGSTFNEEAANGEEFARLDYVQNGFLASFQFVAISALSGSFMVVVENS